MFRPLMPAGRFITFEGIEGSGKSTQIRLLAEQIESRGQDVHLLREPGGTAVGDRVRAILLDAELDDMTDETEMLLFAASRAQLVRREIRPAMAAGKTVLCDRFLHSSLAYQGYARGLGRDKVYEANRPAIDGLLPDRVVLLDLAPSVALERAKARGNLDRIEAESLTFHQQVREGFLAEAQLDPTRFLVVSAEGSPEEIHRAIRAGLEDSS
ncbi:MAG: dTMP kinase [Myxococcota bacterium]|nr:dTMP kinase [Myxococcota bacterium]